MSESWRLFIALELPTQVLEAIARVQAALKKQAPERVTRWVHPESIHLTLKFLGDVPLTQLDSLREALAQAALGQVCFDLSTDRLGCFPNTRQPRVIWLGVEGALDRLRALQAAVEQHVSPLGFPPEGRGFSPHLTLARIDRRADHRDVATVGQLIETQIGGHSASWRVDSVSLMRSELRPTGAVYTRVYRVALERG